MGKRAGWLLPSLLFSEQISICGARFGVPAQAQTASGTDTSREDIPACAVRWLARAMSTSISRSLPRDLTLLRHGAVAAERALGNHAQGVKIDLDLGVGSAEGVAVHVRFS